MRHSLLCLLCYRCVLNWFGDWSNGAFYQVGKEFTSKIDLEKANVSLYELYFVRVNVSLTMMCLLQSDWCKSGWKQLLNTNKSQVNQLCII